MRQLGLGAGQIATHQAGPTQMHVRRRDRLRGHEPHRVNPVEVCCGQVHGRLLEKGTGGVELAAKPRQNPGHNVGHRAEPLPALLDTRAQRLEHLG